MENKCEKCGAEMNERYAVFFVTDPDGIVKWEDLEDKAESVEFIEYVCPECG